MKKKQSRRSAVQLLHGLSAALFLHRQIVGFLMLRLI